MILTKTSREVHSMKSSKLKSNFEASKKEFNLPFRRGRNSHLMLWSLITRQYYFSSTYIDELNRSIITLDHYIANGSNHNKKGCLNHMLFKANMGIFFNCSQTLYSYKISSCTETIFRVLYSLYFNSIQF